MNAALIRFISYKLKNKVTNSSKYNHGVFPEEYIDLRCKHVIIYFIIMTFKTLPSEVSYQLWATNTDQADIPVQNNKLNISLHSLCFFNLKPYCVFSFKVGFLLLLSIVSKYQVIKFIFCEEKETSVGTEAITKRKWT